MPISIDQIRNLIDTDILAAFAEMDKLEWGNRRGDYNGLKDQWIDTPVGSSESDLRARLKLILTYAKFPEDLKEIQKQAKDKIIRGTDLAIQYLEGKLKDGPTKTNLSLIKAEWQAYRREEMLGVLDFHQKQFKVNNLRLNVMTFIDGLREEDLL